MDRLVYRRVANFKFTNVTDRDGNRDPLHGNCLKPVSKGGDVNEVYTMQNGKNREILIDSLQFGKIDRADYAKRLRVRFSVEGDIT